jgi:integrase
VQAPKDPDSRRADFVFRPNHRGRIRESHSVRRYFKPLLNAAQLPNVWLYQTAAMIALAAGVPPRIVSEQLGHASVAFSLDVYSRVLPHLQHAAVEKVQALLFSAMAVVYPVFVAVNRGGITSD